MSKRSKKIVIKEEKVIVEKKQQKAPEEQKISFDLWWALVNRTRKEAFPSWMKEIFAVDFKARGCSKLETRSKYDEALKAFGY